METLQTAASDEFKADLTESKCRLAVAEAESGSGHPASQDGIGEALRVTVASFEAEIHRFEGGQEIQVRIRKKGRNIDLGQNVDSRDRLWVAHHRQIGDVLLRPAPKSRPDLLPSPPPFS